MVDTNLQSFQCSHFSFLPPSTPLPINTHILSSSFPAKLVPLPQHLIARNDSPHIPATQAIFLGTLDEELPFLCLCPWHSQCQEFRLLPFHFYKTYSSFLTSHEAISFFSRSQGVLLFKTVALILQGSSQYFVQLPSIYSWIPILFLYLKSHLLGGRNHAVYFWISFPVQTKAAPQALDKYL